jgi:Fe-S-cluster containining protein
MTIKGKTTAVLWTQDSDLQAVAIRSRVCEKMMSDQLKQWVLDAAARPEVSERVAQLYAELQEQIDKRRPVCSLSGRCCRFEEYGHQLYVTTLELAAFVRGLSKPMPASSMGAALLLGTSLFSGGVYAAPGPRNSHPTGIQKRRVNAAAKPGIARPVPKFGVKPSSTGCPFQVGKICTVHTIRPFGCRVFFCDPTSQGWQQEQYEHFHARLKGLHEELSVPYSYVEWRKALTAIGASVMKQESF